MVIYSHDVNPNVPSVTGSKVPVNFIPWQPSSWPPAPAQFNADFYQIFKRIIRETILNELHHVVGDITAAHQVTHANEHAMEHRGHVVAVAYMCALDASARYGYGDDEKKYVAAFVHEHFPPKYKAFAERIYPAYRVNLVHAWNLFGNAAMSPNDDEVREENGVIYFGIMNFVRAFDDAVTDFLDRLKNDEQLQQAVLSRYAEVMAWEKKGATAKTASSQK